MIILTTICTSLAVRQYTEHETTFSRKEILHNIGCIFTNLS